MDTWSRARGGAAGGLSINGKGVTLSTAWGSKERRLVNLLWFGVTIESQWKGLKRRRGVSQNPQQ
jgi:hypothetical protein